MKDNSMFEIVCDVIGSENATKLQEICGGMVFYIPIKPKANIAILNDYHHLISIGNSHKVAVINIAQKTEMNYSATNKRIKRLLECQS